MQEFIKLVIRCDYFFINLSSTLITVVTFKYFKKPENVHPIKPNLFNELYLMEKLWSKNLNTTIYTYMKRNFENSLENLKTNNYN